MENDNGYFDQHYTKTDHRSTVLHILASDEDNHFSRDVRRNQGGLSLTVRCSFRAKKSNKAKDVSEFKTVNPVKRRRKKKPPSALARSRRRLSRFLEKKSAGNQELASPEDKQNIASVHQLLKLESVNDFPCEKELENAGPTSGSKGIIH